MTSSAKPRPELFNLKHFGWVFDDFSSGERILIIVQAGVA